MRTPKKSVNMKGYQILLLTDKQTPLTRKLTKVCHRICDLTGSESLTRQANRYNEIAKNKEIILPTTGMRSVFRSFSPISSELVALLQKQISRLTKKNVPPYPTATTLEHSIKQSNPILILCEYLCILFWQNDRYFWFLFTEDHR